MRVLPEALAASLASGATTLCRCWTVERTDGVVLGFTDHDRNISFDGMTFEAESGLNATTVEIALGLSIDSHGVTGALQSEAISEDDLARGLFDSAEITLWMVDWTDAASRLLVSRGFVGEIRRRGAYFEAEVVGLAELLNQPHGRAFLNGCDARLGDSRCGLDLAAPEWRGAAVVAEVLAPQFYRVTGLESFETGFFAHGAATWTGGQNTGLEGRVKHHSAGTVELWLAPPAVVGAGDTMDLAAGCDKSAETCRTKFNNFNNFRGFPHMPGDDWAAGYADEGGAHDGGSLFRG